MSPLTEKIGKLKDAGVRRKDIADQLGMSEKAVKRHLEKYRVAEKATETPAQKAKFDVLRERYEGQIRHLGAKYRVLTQRAALEERLLDAAVNCIQAFPTPPPRKLVLPNTADPSDIEEAVVVCSDWHNGEVVSSLETLGIGGFNKNIAARRVEHLSEKFTGLIQMHRTNAVIKKAWALVLGDMLSGKIHLELEKTADGDIMEQVVRTAYFLAQFLYDISLTVEELEVVAVAGNHGRLEKKPEFKKSYVNWDVFCYQIAALMLKNVKNIKWNIPKSKFAVATINGQRFMCTHGDIVRGWMGIPYYDMARKAYMINDMMMHVDAPVDGFIIGHFHSGNVQEKLNGPMLVNGALVGTSEFSTVALATASRPMQYCFGVHNRQGMSWRYPIWLDNIPNPDAPLRYTVDPPDTWADGQIVPQFMPN